MLYRYVFLKIYLLFLKLNQWQSFCIKTLMSKYVFRKHNFNECLQLNIAAFIYLSAEANTYKIGYLYIHLNYGAIP